MKNVAQRAENVDSFQLWIDSSQGKRDCGNIIKCFSIFRNFQCEFFLFFSLRSDDFDG